MTALISDSEGSTDLFTPEPERMHAVIENREDDAFAWLRPHSDAACRAFDASVNSMLKNPEKYHHARQFLHLSGREDRAASVYTEDGAQDSSIRQWTGAFALSLDILPHDPAMGWYFGTSRGGPLEKVDLLLAPPIRKWRDIRLAGRHGRLYFHPESCRMMLEARHAITTTKNKASIIRDSTSCVIEHAEMVAIGDYTYIFEFTSLHPTSEFEKALIRFMQKHNGPQWSLNKLLSPASIEEIQSVGDYYLPTSAFAQGTYGKVHGGWTLKGQPVAIKILKQPKEADVKRHQELMELIGHHPNIIQLVQSIHHFKIPVPDATLVYTPLAVSTLTDLLEPYRFDLPAKVNLMDDYLKGLSFLHKKGIMHRDISPNNLAVTSFEEPKGLIIDLDAATKDLESEDHMKGTVPYLAPEIIALKNYQPGNYNRSVDVWALGLSMFAMHTGSPIRWTINTGQGVRHLKAVTDQSFRVYQEKLDGFLGVAKDGRSRKMLELIREMTKFNFLGRISASVASRTCSDLRTDDSGRLILKTSGKRSRED